MTTCTPIYQLPVVEGSDRPCGIDDWSCAFAAAVETQLDAIDATVARTATTVPMVKVAQTIPRVIDQSNDDDVVIEFDTVFVDTDNMFDATSSAVKIVFPSAGIYNFTYNVRATTTGGGNQTSFGGAIFLSLPPAGFGSSVRPAQESRVTQTGQPMYQSGTGIFPVTAGATAFLELLLQVQGADTISLNYVEVIAHWLGDLP